jgi:hypothetical protein
MEPNLPTGETMSEGPDIPPSTAPAAPMKKPMGPQIRVPLKSLAMPGEDDHMNNPEIGDTVEFHGQGKVSGIEGDNALVSLDTVNGDPVTAEAAAVNDTPEADEFEQLRQESAGRMV